MENLSVEIQRPAPPDDPCPPGAVLFLLYSLVILTAYLVDVASHGLLIQVAGPCLPPSLAVTWFEHEAVADATFTVLLPLTLTWTSSAWPLDPHLAVLTFHASGRLLTHTTANTFTALLQPTWALTHRQARRAVSWADGVWLLLLVLGEPSMWALEGRGHWDGSYNTTSAGLQPGCSPDLAFSGPALNQLVFGFGIPLGVLSMIRGLMGVWLKLARLTGRLPPLGAPWALGVGLFLYWFPFHLLLLLQLLGSRGAGLGLGDVWVLLRPLGFTMVGPSSSLNPLLYVFGGQVFRQQLCQALRTCGGWGWGEGGG